MKKLSANVVISLEAYSARVKIVERTSIKNLELLQVISRRLGKILELEKLSVFYWEKTAESKKHTVDVVEFSKHLWRALDGGLSEIWDLLERYGGLFPGKEKDLLSVKRELEALRLLLVLKAGTTPKNGVPPVALIEDRLLIPLHRSAETWPENKEWTVWGSYMDVPFYVPAEKGVWPVFHTPTEWSMDRDGIIKYAQKELTRNVNRRLRKLRAEVKTTGIVVKPICLYDALLAWICLDVKEAKKKKTISTASKHRVLGSFQKWKSRGKISSEDYEQVRKAVCEAWDKGLRNEKELRELSHAAIGNVLQKL